MGFTINENIAFRYNITLFYAFFKVKEKVDPSPNSD